MQNELPKRKHPRLDNYDYSTAGAYFVTICVRDRLHVFSDITKIITNSVEYKTQLTSYGKIAEAQLLSLPKRYPFLTIDRYVIMPDHIHVVFVFDRKAEEQQLRPSVTDIVCAYKSLTAKECKQNGFNGDLFQTSFYEHIIRNEQDYSNIVEYIYDNPKRKYYDEAKK